MNKSISLIFLLLFSFSDFVMAQSEMTVFNSTGRAGVSTTFATDYQTLGINPANLGMPDKFNRKIAFGFFETGFSFFSRALTKKDIKEEVLSFNSDTKFSFEEKKLAAKAFVDNGFIFNFDVMPIGFGINIPKIGGFAFSVKSRNMASMQLDSFVSNLLFLGYNFTDYFDTIVVYNGDTIGIPLVPKNFSELIDGTKIKVSAIMEFNVGFGRQIFSKENWTLYGGLGIKYILGYAIFDVDISDGNAEGFTAFTPQIPIDYGAISSPSLDTSGKFTPVGRGMGFDFGVTAVINEKLKIGVSVVDIGSIKWSGNVLKLKDFPIDSLGFSGADNYDLFNQLQNITGGDAVFQYEGLASKKETLPSKLRFGASYMLWEDIEIGIDIILPFNDVAGNFQKPFFLIGGDFFSLIRFSTGIVTGGSYGFNIPLGITVLIPPKKPIYEVGFATRDIATYFGQNNPTLSASFGFLRFRF